MRGELYLALAVLGMNLFAAYWGAVTAPSFTGAAVGMVQGNVSFTILSADVCDIDLSQGWNLISICSNVTNTSIFSVFDKTQGNIRFVLDWEESQQRFRVFSPLQMNPPFTTFNLSKSYFVYYDNATNTTEDVQQNPRGDINLSLVQSYNTPVYPYEFATNISLYLGPIANKTNFVLLWNASAQEFVVFSPLAADPPVKTIDKGDGQFILVSAVGGSNLTYRRDDLDNV